MSRRLQDDQFCAANAAATGSGRLFPAPNVADVGALTLPREIPIAYVTETTLRGNATRDVIFGLKARFTDNQGPDIPDICYATQNRQSAVRNLSKLVDVTFAVGATSNSNANLMRDIGTDVGIASVLIADRSEINPDWLTGAKTVGITARASVPEVLVGDVIDALKRIGPVAVSILPGRGETIAFCLPCELASVQASRSEVY